VSDYHRYGFPEGHGEISTAEWAERLIRRAVVDEYHVYTAPAVPPTAPGIDWCKSEAKAVGKFFRRWLG
jgi:hypothetical protein